MQTLPDPYWLHIIHLEDGERIEATQYDYTDSDRGVTVRVGEGRRVLYPWTRVRSVDSFLTTDAEQTERFRPDPADCFGGGGVSCEHRFEQVNLRIPDQYDGGLIPGRWYRCTRCREAGYEVPE